MSNTSHEQWVREQNERLKLARESREPFQTHRMENLRKQAKELLEQFRSGDPTAIDRFIAKHPNYPKPKICLADAQSVIAREHDYSSWPKMKSALEHTLLTDEVERIRKKLVADGKEQFLPIMTEESLKSAIRKRRNTHSERHAVI